MTKRLYIQTFGCQMNVHDSEVVEGLLREKGYQTTDQPDDADLIFVNTCSVRDKAEHKLYSLLGTFRDAKKANPALQIAVGGCVAQQDREEILKRSPYVNFVVGTHQFRHIADIVEQANQPTSVPNGTSVKPLQPRGVFTQWRNKSTEERFDEPVWHATENRYSSYVTVMEGCDNVCSFCIVPFTRGREISRRPADVLRAVQDRVADGAKEIVLLGQNVNAYGRSELSAKALAEDMQQLGDSPFATLLRLVAEVDGVERLRFTSPHPADMDEGMIQAYADIDKLCAHVHLPAQSGSNRILEAMKRGYSREHYLDCVRRFRQARPDITFTTDLIVGFPGETEEDFRATIDLMEEADFDQVFAFVYSPRPGTAALRMDDETSDERKLERLQELFTNQRVRQLAKNEALIGKTLDVLFTEYDPAQHTASGRSETNKIIHVETDLDIRGHILPVVIVKARTNSLSGALVGISDMEEYVV